MMSTTTLPRPPLYAELQTGDRMSRAEFHRLYEAAPAGFRAELIGGVVYVASPLYLPHGKHHLALGALMLLYEEATPGVEASDNTTICLGDDSEPQPDLFLRILPGCGGQSATGEDLFVLGPPELIVEVTHSTRAIDLHVKKEEYRRYGVREYIVACLRERELRWFDLATDHELPLDADGVLRSREFPGLWISARALWNQDRTGLLRTARLGVSQPEHAEFVDRLRQRGAGL